MGLDLSSVNALAELERIDWQYEPVGANEVRCCCPLHEDSHPSCSINTLKNVFNCHTAGCNGKGDIITFLAAALKTTRRVVFEDLKGRYGIDAPKTISLETVERYHEAIWKHQPLLTELRKRGVTDEIIKRHKLGMFRNRITIPVYDKEGRCINIRKYSPGAPGPLKMRNTKGYGAIELYPIDQLKFPKIVLCGGEMKALVAASLLNEVNIGAISTTAGEGSWKAEFDSEFQEKEVFVCFDVDSEGRRASDKICRLLSVRSPWVGKVNLPLDEKEFPHGDINDWVMTGASAEDFLGLLDSVAKWEPPQDTLVDAPVLQLELADSVDAANVGRRIEMQAMIVAMDTSPYVIPKSVNIECGRDQTHCGICPLYLLTPDEKGVYNATIPADSPAILNMVDAPRTIQHNAILEGLGAPPCKTVDFRIQEYYNVEDVRLSPRLQVSNMASSHIVQQAMFTSRGANLNEDCIVSGRMYPHPRTQQSVILATSRKTVSDTLTNYQPTSEELETLQQFTPESWTLEGLTKKLDEIYLDLEQHVTHIYLRRQLHLVLDLAWHSVLLIEHDGHTTKGWSEILVLGDSSQGKSETTLQMMRHYDLGEKVEMKNASVAGLLGGLHQIGNRWFVSWGTIPTHDRRLVVLEELKGASTDLIAKLTDMRSSGVAEIPKIQRRKTHARTRLIALSNPRSDRTLASYSFGIEAIKELIGNLEDIRRFDLITLLSADDVDSEQITELQGAKPTVPHKFTAELCKSGVLWAWTRKPDQIQITDDAATLLRKECARLCQGYTETIPIVDKGSIRLKVLRLSAALACRTFSHDGDFETLVIRECHVEYIIKLMNDIYSSRIFGYKDFSDVTKSMACLIDPDAVKQQILQTPFPSDFVRQILHHDDIELRDICDWCAWGSDDAIELLSFLVRKHALKRHRSSYKKTAQFIELLKSLEQTAKEYDRPAHVGEHDEF